jgi:hypothetical protein
LKLHFGTWVVLVLVLVLVLVHNNCTTTARSLEQVLVPYWRYYFLYW